MGSLTETNHQPTMVNTTLNYQLEGAANYFHAGTVGHYMRKFDTRNVQIADMRTCDEQFSLDKQGFELHGFHSAEQSFEDDVRIQSVVYPEVAELLKKVTGASRVHVFSHYIRKNRFEDAAEASSGKADETSLPHQIPARYVHCDQTNDGAVEVLHDNMSAEDAERLSKTRWGIVNVWKPFELPAKRDPLALCDARTTLESDLIPVKVILGGGVYVDLSQGKGFEIWQARANPDHKWYFASDVSTEEAIVLRIFDSKCDGRARRTLHCAFEDPRTKQLKVPRQSIEIRSLVFWEDQSTE